MQICNGMPSSIPYGTALWIAIGTRLGCSPQHTKLMPKLSSTYCHSSRFAGGGRDAEGLLAPCGASEGGCLRTSSSTTTWNSRPSVPALTSPSGGATLAEGAVRQALALLVFTLLWFVGLLSLAVMIWTGGDSKQMSKGQTRPPAWRHAHAACPAKPPLPRLRVDGCQYARPRAPAPRRVLAQLPTRSPSWAVSFKCSSVPPAAS